MRTFAQDQDHARKSASSDLPSSRKVAAGLLHGADERDPLPVGTGSPRLAHDFGRIAVHSPAAQPLHPELAAGTPGETALRIATEGTRGGGIPLPHRDEIQRSFGHHDLGHVRAHTDRAARAATGSFGADAFATGHDVAFARPPDLFTAAHEAAHVVQQQRGVQLKGGVGEAGDVYEQQADAAAEAVVAGRSAEAILDETPAAGGGGGVQFRGGAFYESGLLDAEAVPRVEVRIGSEIRIFKDWEYQNFIDDVRYDLQRKTHEPDTGYLARLRDFQAIMARIAEPASGIVRVMRATDHLRGNPAPPVELIQDNVLGAWRILREVIEDDSVRDAAVLIERMQHFERVFGREIARLLEWELESLENARRDMEVLRSVRNTSIAVALSAGGAILIPVGAKVTVKTVAISAVVGAGTNTVEHTLTELLDGNIPTFRSLAVHAGTGFLTGAFGPLADALAYRAPTLLFMLIAQIGLKSGISTLEGLAQTYLEGGVNDRTFLRTFFIELAESGSQDTALTIADLIDGMMSLAPLILEGFDEGLRTL